MEMIFRMNSFLLRVEHVVSRAGDAPIIGLRGLAQRGACGSRAARGGRNRPWEHGNSHSVRVPGSGWTIIRSSFQILRGRDSIAVTRKLRALLFGCITLCMVVFACAGNMAAQSRPSKSPNSRAGAANAKPAERADVARFRQRAESALSVSGPDKGFWGVLVTDAATGEILYARNAGNYFTPASDAKLFTTALALATLGPDYRIRTTYRRVGTLDANGRLSGDLVLTGRGDANLSNRKFPYEKKVERDGPPERALAALADSVVARGVKEIDGGVVADDSLFQLERFPSGWTIDDMLWSYGAAVSAIAVNDNTFTIELRPGEREGDGVAFTVEPASDFYAVENTVRTSARGSEEKLAAAREPGSRTIRLSGTIPAGAPPRKLVFAVEEPAEYAAALLARLLEARGIRIHGGARGRHAGDPELLRANRPAENHPGGTHVLAARRRYSPDEQEQPEPARGAVVAPCRARKNRRHDIRRSGEIRRRVFQDRGHR